MAVKRMWFRRILALLSVVFWGFPAWAVRYEVGPGRDYETIGEVPLEALAAGDTLQIHHRAEPYREKWVMTAQGDPDRPVVVSGVPNPVSGDLPVISGENAVTRSQLDFWSEGRGILKIGGSNTPADVEPAYIVIENLVFENARSAYSFDNGTFSDNASGIFLERGSHITVRNCTFRNCGNGFFSAWNTSDIVVEGCYFHDNGNAGSIYEHNNYTESRGIVFQFNRFGPLCDGCSGNNLKDRSSGSVIRYNYIEGGNRQLDLVESGHDHQLEDPNYRTTYVYGNILVEPEGAGNSQVLHYGGDGGDPANYRKGTLYFYHNTVVSTRAGNTTLMRLSSDGESAVVFNNLLFVTQTGSRLGIVDSEGHAVLFHNWLKSGWNVSHGSGSADVRDSLGNLEGEDPGFANFDEGNYSLSQDSPCRSGAALVPASLPFPDRQYVRHRGSEARPADTVPDIGAFEYAPASPVLVPLNRTNRPVDWEWDLLGRSHTPLALEKVFPK